MQCKKKKNKPWHCKWRCNTVKVGHAKCWYAFSTPDQTKNKKTIRFTYVFELRCMETDYAIKFHKSYQVQMFYYRISDSQDKVLVRVLLKIPVVVKTIIVGNIGHLKPF